MKHKHCVHYRCALSIAVAIAMTLVAGQSSIASPEAKFEKTVGYYELSQDDATIIRSTRSANVVVHKCLETGEESIGTSYTIDGFDISSGSLASVFAENEHAGLHAFLAMGGTITMVEFGQDWPSHLLLGMPADPHESNAAIVAKGDGQGVEWLRDLIEQILRDLDWLADPDHQSPSDSVPDPEQEDNEEADPTDDEFPPDDEW